MGHKTEKNNPPCPITPPSRHLIFIYRLHCFNPYSAGIDFSRQNLTKVDPRTVRVKIFLMAVDP